MGPTKATSNLGRRVGGLYALTSSASFFLAPCCSAALPHYNPNAPPQHHHATMGKRRLMNGEPVNTGKEVIAPKKVPSKTKGKRMSSTATGGQLERLANGGYLPQPIVTFSRSPVVVAENSDVLAEAMPKPEPHERVIFIPFLIRGLGFPIHPFFRGFLHFYCLK